MKPIGGSCLCGKVRYEIVGPFQFFRYCHCPRCRKATGSGNGCNIFLVPEQFKWLAGQELVARYDLPEAKSFATCFCTTCGSPLPHATRSGAAVMVPAGSLDEDPEIRPENSIFWENRAPWYIEPGSIPNK